MMSHDLERVAESLVADGKGILAADETTPTLTKRFDILGIASTEQSRRTYREMLFTSPGAADFISGAIMYDETIRQKTFRRRVVCQRLLKAKASCPGSRWTPARSPSLPLLKRPLLKGSTDYGIV